jgi:hypothetical protein
MLVSRKHQGLSSRRSVCHLSFAGRVEKNQPDLAVLSRLIGFGSPVDRQVGNTEAD